MAKNSSSDTASMIKGIAVLAVCGLAIKYFQDYWPYILGAAIVLIVLILTAKNKRRKMPIQFIGNQSTKMYHMPTCQTLQNVKKSNLVGFVSREEAERAGYRPCGRCHILY